MHQEALRSGDESVFERANEYAEMALGKLEQPLYGPEQMGEMRERYKDAEDAVKREAEAVRAEKARDFSMLITNTLADGNLAMDDEKGNTILVKDLIRANDSITPAEKRTLLDRADKVASGDTSFTPLQHALGYRDLNQTAHDVRAGRKPPEALNKSMAQYGHMVSPDTRQRLIDWAHRLDKGTDSQQKTYQNRLKIVGEEAIKASTKVLPKEEIKRDREANIIESPAMAAFAGEAQDRYETWWNSFPDDKKPNDREGRVNQAEIIYGLMQEVEEGRWPPGEEEVPEPVKKPKKKPVIPQEVLEQLPPDVRERVLKAPAYKQRRFLEAYQQAKAQERERQANERRRRETDLLGVNEAIESRILR
jgi:hypothetical protein